MLVSINPGSPNKGSITQYFIGDFDGISFTTKQEETIYLDYGPDNYAGVTYSNVDDRKLLIGWMSNWLYASETPTGEWRGAMTIPRELGINKINGKKFLTNLPLREWKDRLIELSSFNKNDIRGKKSFEITKNIALVNELCFDIDASSMQGFTLSFKNNTDTLLFLFDLNKKTLFLDRSKSGITDFNKEFANEKITMPLPDILNYKVQIILDKSSVEIFTHKGENTMTAVFYPNDFFNKISFDSTSVLGIDNISLKSYKNEN